MTARSDVQSTVTAKLYISANLPAAYTQVEYESTDVAFTQVKQVENLGEHGVDRQILTFTPIDDGVIQKLPGSKDYGQMQVMLGYIPGDAGQTIVKAASESQNRYSIKVEYAPGNGESTGEVHYMEVIVKTFRVSDGDANTIRKATATMELCRAPVIVAAS